EHLLVMGAASRFLRLAGPPTVDPRKGEIELRGQIHRGFLEGSGEGESAPLRKLAVEKRESLRRYRGLIAPLAGDLAPGAIEYFQQRIGERAVTERVNGSPVALARRGRREIRRRHRAHDVARLKRHFPIDLREDAGAAHLGI